MHCSEMDRECEYVDKYGCGLANPETQCPDAWGEADDIDPYEYSDSWGGHGEPPERWWEDSEYRDYCQSDEGQYWDARYDS